MPLSGANYTKAILADPSGNQYSEFVGAFEDGDDIYVGYAEALGDTNPATRGAAPQWVYDAMGTTYSTWFSSYPDGSFDFWNLDNNHQFLKSTNFGTSFSAFRTDDMDTLVGLQGNGHFYPHPFFPQAHVKLSNGDWLRRVNGEDTKWMSYYPGTAYLQRQVNGTGSWVHAGTGQAASHWGTTTSTTVQVSRMREIEPGVILASGQDFRQAAGTRSGVNYTAPFLAVSTDYGFTWSSALTLPSGWSTPGSLTPARTYFNEWDWAILPNGKLLVMVRTGGAIPWDGTGSVSTNRRYDSAIWDSDGTHHWTYGGTSTWALNSEVGGSSEPTHPDLIPVTAGDSPYVLFLTRANSPAPDAFYYYDVNAATWGVLGMSPAKQTSGTDPYYPKTLVHYDADNVPIVNVFGHNGWDNYPGQLNMQVVQHRFTLPANTTPPPPGGDTVPALLKLGGQLHDLR